MLKKLILLIFLLNVASSMHFGISPTEINLETDANKVVCKEIELIGKNLVFNGEIKWSEEKTQIMNEYKIDSEELNIKMEFSESVSSGKNNICFLAKNSGKYYGVLKYKIQNSPYGIFSPIELDVNQDGLSEDIEKINLISGKVIQERTNFILTGIFFLLTLILVLMLITNKKQL